MNNPKISIVIPVCNVENYLKECMDSVLNQSLRDIEIICVNDGSTDNSLQILREYEQKDDRVKIISKSNSGYGNTMNVGMDAATGEYIGIVESDDYVEHNMFERLYEAACLYECDIVKSDHYIFTTKEGKQNKKIQYICPEQYYERVLNVDICEEIYDFAMMNWTGIYNIKFIRENHIRHNETPGASFQDNGFWFQALSLARKIVFIHEAFYYYRQDNPNSSINSKAKVYCICDEYEYIQNFVISHKHICDKHFTKFFTKKVFNYLHSYERIAEEFKIPFLQRIGKEFEEDLKLPYIKVEKLDPWILETVNRIIDDPQLYYEEDTRYSLKKEYEKIHDLLITLRNSEELKKGIKIKSLFMK